MEVEITSGGGDNFMEVEITSWRWR